MMFRVSSRQIGECVKLFELAGVYERYDRACNAGCYLASIRILLGEYNTYVSGYRRTWKYLYHQK